MISHSDVLWNKVWKFKRIKYSIILFWNYFCLADVWWRRTWTGFPHGGHLPVGWETERGIFVFCISYKWIQERWLVLACWHSQSLWWEQVNLFSCLFSDPVNAGLPQDLLGLLCSSTSPSTRCSRAPGWASAGWWSVSGGRSTKRGWVPRGFSTGRVHYREGSVQVGFSTEKVHYKEGLVKEGSSNGKGSVQEGFITGRVQYSWVHGV